MGARVVVELFGRGDAGGPEAEAEKVVSGEGGVDDDAGAVAEGPVVHERRERFGVQKVPSAERQRPRCERRRRSSGCGGAGDEERVLVVTGAQEPASRHTLARDPNVWSEGESATRRSRGVHGTLARGTSRRASGRRPATSTASLWALSSLSL